MDKIVVKNTCIVINDYNFNDCINLEKQFRVYDPLTHSIHYVGIYYDKDERKLYLPRGVDIWYVEKLLNCKATVERNMYNPFDRYDDIKIRFLPRNEDQQKAIRFMVGSGEYMETSTKSQLQLNLNTGKGKTYCSIAAMAYLGIKSIIITDAVSILKQWKESILEFTNLPPNSIYYIDGSKSITYLLSKSQTMLNRKKVYLVSHSTLQSYASVNGWQAVGDLFKHIRVGLKFYDEAHKNFSNMLMIDFFTTVYKTYYITATPERSSMYEDRIYQLCFKNVLAIDLFHQDSDPHTNYIAIRYSSRPSPVDISNCRNNYGLDRNKYTDYIVNNEAFRKMALVVLDIALKLAPEKNQKILIYIGTNKAINIFRDYLISMFPGIANDIGVYTSIRSKEERAQALSCKKIILSTTKSTGTAIDIKGLKVTIVLAEPFKSNVLAKQTLGRTRDSDTYYIDVVDKGFYYCNQYFLSKKPLFAKYAISTQLVEVSDDELENKYMQVVGHPVNMCDTAAVRPFTIRPFYIAKPN